MPYAAGVQLVVRLFSSLLEVHFSCGHWVVLVVATKVVELLVAVVLRLVVVVLVAAVVAWPSGKFSRRRVDAILHLALSCLKSSAQTV